CGIIPVRFDVAVPAIGLENRDDIDGVCSRKRSVALDNNQVVIVFARGLKSEVMGSGHHYGVCAKRMDDDNLAMDVDHTGAEEFLLPGTGVVFDVSGNENIVI